MPVVIHLGNSYSTVKGLSDIQYTALRKVLSYRLDPTASYFAGFGPKVKYMIDARGNFPTGLIKRVQAHLQQSGIVYEIVVPERRKRPPVNHGVDLAGITPYPAQNAAVAALGPSNHRGIISMPTGTGKSLVIALIIAKLKVRTLVVVPNLSIKEQLCRSLDAIFKDMSNITVENIDSNALNNTQDYDCLIIDEAHHAAAKTYQTLNKRVWNDVFFRYFLTATPFRNNTEETLLFEGIAGQVIYELSYKEAVRQRYIVPVEAFYVELEKTRTTAVTWAQVYSELVVNNSTRNLAIVDLLKMFQSARVSALCLVKEVNHGEKLAELAGTYFAHGTNPDTPHLITLFNNTKLKTLIGTNGILGEGVDTKPCEYVIIAGLGKAKSAFMQQVGRAVRKYPDKESAKVILIKDKSHKFTLRHFKAQCDILWEEYGIVPTKLE